MDFPIFHLDFIGNRMLIAIIAILHVIINHALAVGFIPLVTLLEYRSFRYRKTNPPIAQKWDDFARKVMFIGFVLTTSIGALTGVGIWFSASLVNPDAIGSLIRVFYSAWFSEWIIFVLEVIFIMLYYLGWKKSNLSLQAKKNHIIFGAALSLFSWFTMAIIVAILGFMMDPGNWLSQKSFFSGVLNPLYIPQLYFRTPMAMMMGGAIILFLTLFFLKKDNPIREKAISFISLWILIWTPVTAVGAILYRSAIPEAMMANFPTAIGTMTFSDWYGSLLLVIFLVIIISVLITLWGFLKPKKMIRPALFVPIIVLCILLGYFERVREFVRKPFVIGEYMYANGLRVSDYKLFQKNGILPYSTYMSTRIVTEENELEAGRNVFMIACSRCHTITGINSVVRKFRHLTSPGEALSLEAIKNYIPKMHKIWYYMPPFPGNQAELDALTKYILQMDKSPQYLEGVQSQGFKLPPIE